MVQVVLIDCIALAAVLLLLVQRRADRKRLRAFVHSLMPMPRDPRAAALHIASVCYRLPHGPDPVFFPALFEPLGATPTAVLRHGGCCSGRSRLLILALAEYAIPAFQITLYHRNGQAQHCLVQAWIDGQPLVIDPSYGIFFSSPDGTPVGLRDLQSGVTPRHLRLPNVTHGGYPDNAYYDFDYTLSRTANWTRTATRRFVYRMLCFFGPDRIDRLAVPPALEWPQHLFIALALGVLAIAHVFVALTS